jgi:hypothetical protein
MSVSGILPARPTTLDLAILGRRIEQQRQIIDANLPRAARWRGELRRAVHRYAKAEEISSYAQAYDKLVVAAGKPQWCLNAESLKEVHRLAVSEARFRTVGLIVGGHHRFPSPLDVPLLVNQVLTSLYSSVEPRAVAAARLHLGLLTVHPFEDGNGRTARLASTLWLVQGGFRSTLLAAVEQHFHPTPDRYFEVLDCFRYEEISEDECVAYLLHAMIANAMYATWFRERESRLRACSADLCIPPGSVDEVLAEYDTEPKLSGYAASLAAKLGRIDPPLHVIKDLLTQQQRTELSLQVQRLLEEEAEQGNSLEHDAVTRY